jgi:hypothetical protein
MNTPFLQFRRIGKLKSFPTFIFNPEINHPQTSS